MNEALGMLGCVCLCVLPKDGAVETGELHQGVQSSASSQKFQEMSEKGSQAEACSSLAPVYLTEMIIPVGQEEN